MWDFLTISNKVSLIGVPKWQILELRLLVSLQFAVDWTGWGSSDGLLRRFTACLHQEPSQHTALVSDSFCECSGVDSVNCWDIVLLQPGSQRGVCKPVREVLAGI